MTKILDINDIETYWLDIIKSNKELIIATVVTKDISNNWSFIYRDKIIRLLAPRPVKILKIEYDKFHCEEISKKSHNKNGYLPIHAVMINDLLNILNDESFCLLIDIDAFPLTKESIKISFITAYLQGVNGNLQRTNCLDNSEHLFIAESFMCFNTKILKALGENAWRVNKRSDVSEEITWLHPEFLSKNNFKPIDTLMKPIWPLKGTKPVYGIGTTFGLDKLKINYHHFFARNFASRLHFYFISFFKYNSIKRKMKDKKIRSFNFLKEFKFTVKYLLGKIS